MVEITSEEQNKVKRMKKTDDSLRDLWDYIKCTNIWIIGVPERREKERKWEDFWRDYSWRFPKYGKGNNQSSPRDAKNLYKLSTKRNTPRHIVIKLTKIKQKEY